VVKFLIKRILQAIPVVFTVITFTFILMKVAPGGPFTSERAVSPEILAQLNKRYHLDDPLFQQYLSYLKNCLLGNFGPSFKYPGRTVNELIAIGFPVSAELGIYALIFALLLGVSSGVIAALGRNTWRDYIPMSFSMIGICLPTILLGPLMVLVFSLHWNFFPTTGWYTAQHKVLPSITLGMVYAAYFARLSRGGMLEILSQDFILTARAKGLRESLVVVKHALQGGLLPVVSFLGPAVAGLLSGSFVIETVFQIPGLGRHFIMAAFNRDYTLIMGITVFYSYLIVFFNLLSDFILVLINPRLSFGSQS
jgi:oligopeptide transport system permease protein